MKLATTTGDFGAYAANAIEAIGYIREAGFRYADINFGKDHFRRIGIYSEDWKSYCADLSARAKELDMGLVQAHAPMGKPLDDPEGIFLAETLRCVHACGELGIPNLVVHSGYLPGIGISETFARNAEFYAPLLTAAAECGVNVLVENFNKMCVPGMYWIDNASDLLGLINYIDHPNFHAVWDAGHGNLQDMPQHEELAILGSHVRALHIQDNMGDHDTHLMPMRGTLNLDSLMTGLQDIGYSGYFTFEANSSFAGSEKTRRPFDGEEKLRKMPLRLRIQEEKLLYEIGRETLEAYGFFEE